MTAIHVMRLIESSDVIACSALLKLFKAGQDEDEQETGSVARNNGRGFSSVDSAFLTSLARQIESNREKRANGEQVYASDLSPRQIAAWRKVAPKYSRQLVALANGEDPSTYRLPKVEEETIPQPEPPCYDEGEEIDRNCPPVDPDEEDCPEPFETPTEFARTSPDPQAVRMERAKTEGPSYKWTRNTDGTLSVTTPSGGNYLVTRTTCTCKDFENVGGEGILCKHILAQPEEETHERPVSSLLEALLSFHPKTQSEAFLLVCKLAPHFNADPTNRKVENHLRIAIDRAAMSDEKAARMDALIDRMDAEDAEREKPAVEETTKTRRSRKAA